MLKIDGYKVTNNLLLKFYYIDLTIMIIYSIIKFIN